MNTARTFAVAPALAAALAAFPALAEETPTTSSAQPGSRTAPIAVALWNPVQTSDENTSIHGFRLDLPYGKNYDVQGLDFGIASETTRNLTGASFTLGSSVGHNVVGVQSGFVLALAGGTVYGLQEGIYAETSKLHGVQFGVVTQVKQRGYGARFAAVNLGDSHEGAEFGIVNYSKRSSGFQLGIVNVTEQLHGVQIGIVNIAKNGFLPFFPVMNAAM